MAAPDLLVIGSGIAGLTAALRADARGARVLVVTKAELSDGATAHAQGGIAGAVGPGDTPAAHAADTLVAGAGLCDEEAVRVLCAEGPERIAELIDAGVAFDRVAGPGSAYGLGLEGAHGRPRILHAGGDATGREIERALVAAVRARGIAVLEHAVLVDLLVEGGRVVGARMLLDDGADGADGADANRAPSAAAGLTFDGASAATPPRLAELRARTVLLATGGAGQLFAHTTNPLVATGDGIAAAWRAGARTADLEFTQFHPTALAATGGFLVSEAVRGEGAVLRDEHGRRFMPDLDSRGELAPRDVVARAIARTMAAQDGRPVLLDATAIAEPGEDPAAFADRLARRFPTIDAAVRAAGLDWSRAPIPVTPAAHYLMGGIATDLDGRTSLPGLLAAGECARTGVHGANRLASNSLLEGAVFGARAADAALADAADAAPAADSPVPAGAAPLPAEDPRPVVDRAQLQQLMWQKVGLMREGAELEQVARTLAGWRAPAPTTRAAVEDRNLLDLARLVVAAALARPGSVGAHHRLDDPAGDAAAPVLAVGDAVPDPAGSTAAVPEPDANTAAAPAASAPVLVPTA